GPNFKADIVVLNNAASSSQAKKDIKEGFVIDSPGEYEIKDVFVLGIQTKSDHLIYQIELEDIKIGYLGEINQSLTDSDLEKIDNIDVLIVPVGGKKNTLSSEAAAEIIREIEPKIVIPSCYQVPGLKAQLDPIEKFLKEMGVKRADVEDKIRLTKKELPEDGIKVMVLKNS
ncbi:MAG: MBL fold metallo-hydrolase, partial [Candidatus Parcubacteria bacterium]|nr:MBL fold metallo-hydrolase [Candidatus Parcubacteria bacterium]